MSRTCRFARRCARFITIYTVVITIVLIVFIRSPVYAVRQHMLRIFHLRAVLFAELLPELYRTGRAIFNAFAARNALIRLNLCRIGTAAHIRRIKQLRCSQRITDIYITVADTENLILAVDISNLMNEAVILRLAEYLHRLFISDVMTLAGLA